MASRWKPSASYETPLLIKLPSDYIQQSPWLALAHKQQEIMHKYMAARPSRGTAGKLPISELNLWEPRACDRFLTARN